MKKLIYVLILLFPTFLATSVRATEMGAYCSSPPYVTRTIKPNILVLMDNSQGMSGSAYGNTYNPTKIYEGYFKAGLKYNYSSGTWVPSETGSFSGNLLNWATTSKYDLLQKILVGGKSTSRQSNVNTLVSESSSWSKTYSDCVFNIDGGILQITETTKDACVLLNATPGWLASNETGVELYNTAVRFKVFWARLVGDLGRTANKAGIFLANVMNRITSIAYAAKPLRISTNNLADAIQSKSYTANVTAEGGSGSGYTWSITLGLLPTDLAIAASGTLFSTTIAGSTTATPGTYSFTVQVKDSANNTATKELSIVVKAPDVRTSQNYNVKICVGNYTNNCNTAGAGTLKSGIIDDYWEKARFGLEDFSQQGSDITPSIENCIPASPKESFLTGVENATAVGSPTLLTPLVNGAYTAVDYFKNNTAANCDPFGSGTYPCTKSFILMITAGEGASLGSNVFTDAVNCGSYANYLSRNTCYGFKNDMRSTVNGATESETQKVSTYIVNTAGSGAGAANVAILSEAATAGGGIFYNPEDASTLKDELIRAFTDILAQAASGTAVSVLTTSSRGIGSMIQAYFLPTKLEETREVWWTGYTQNIWIDAQDNLREDTANTPTTQKNLILNDDRVMKLYFDEVANETKAALFRTDADGSGGNLATCGDEGADPPAISPFKDVKSVWEAGDKLAGKAPTKRKLFTSTKILRRTGGTTQETTINPYDFTFGNISSNTTLKNALNRDATYTPGDIVRYIRGECLEAGKRDPNGTCGETVDPNFRDRRLTTAGGALKVWKLGDIISSTPKVFANTPLNTYHLDYADSSYFAYTHGSSYSQRSSIAFVGANDGMLHAFRVGYLKDKNMAGHGGALLAGVKALFKNFYSDTSDTSNDRLGEEVWGYVPFNSFPYLKYLAMPSYKNCHLYFNDLSVRLVDASIGADPAIERNTDGSSWRTILIGGMRFGGAPDGGTPPPPAEVTGVGFSSYYAIDITDPEQPVPMWEFSDEDMGFATTFPSVIRTGLPDKNGNWYVVFGSGSTQLPKAGSDIARPDKEGYLYILNLKTGDLVKKIALSDKAMVGDILATDANKNYESENVYFGTTYKSGSDWMGKLMSLAIPSDVTSLCGSGVAMTYANCTTGAKPLRELFSGSYPFTASPDAAKDVDGNIWVYAGSGKYNSDVDETDTLAQIFLGLKDKSGITYPLLEASLDNNTGFRTEGDVKTTADVCDYNGTGFSFMKYVTSITPTSGTVTAPTYGWRFMLSGGERVISRPLAVGGLVDFLTYKPSANPCSYGGDSYLYSLGYTTGVAPTNISIHSPEMTVDKVTGVNSTRDGIRVKPGILLGPGAPPTGEAIIIPPPKEGQETLKKKIQIATGVIVETENSPAVSVVSKIVHWLRK